MELLYSLQAIFTLKSFRLHVICIYLGKSWPQLVGIVNILPASVRWLSCLTPRFTLKVSIFLPYFKSKNHGLLIDGFITPITSMLIKK